MRCDHHPFDEEIAYLRQPLPCATRGKPRLCELRRSKPRICLAASTAFHFDVIPSREFPPSLDESPPTASTPSVKFDPQNILNTLPWQGKTGQLDLWRRPPCPSASFHCPPCAHNPTMVVLREMTRNRHRQTKTPPRRSATAGVFGMKMKTSSTRVRASACRRRAALPDAADPTEPAESAGDTSRSSA